jgi:hypothetical protein
MEEESGDGSVEQEVKTPPPSVVVGAFASPGGQVAPLLSGQVATPGAVGGISGTSPYAVMAGVQPKLSFSGWYRQLISTNNGRFKLLLVGTIVSLMTVVPIFMDIAYDNGYYDHYGGTELEEKVTIDGVEMKVTSFPDSAEIDQIEWIDVEIKDEYWEYNCWAEQGDVQDSQTTQADGETWYKLECQSWRNNDWSVAWLAVDDDANLLLAHEDEYARWIEYETSGGEALEIIADFLPVVGCLLIPISIIGIFVTRHEKSPAKLVH